MKTLPAMVPATVVSYDRQRRECRVEIPGLTDGAEEFPVAQFAYPIGDKSEHTEIRILAGDRIWVSFEQGDPRFPIIMGFRPKQVGNEDSVEYRRFHMENIETDADETQKHTAGTNYTVEAGEAVAVTAGTTMLLEAGESITLKVGGTTITLTAESIAAIASAITLDGPVAHSNGDYVNTGGDVKADAITLKTHKHPTAGSGPPSMPIP